MARVINDRECGTDVFAHAERSTLHPLILQGYKCLLKIIYL